MPEPSSGPTSALRVVARDAYGDWEAVYVNNVVAVYRLVFRHVGNRPDAEDLTEEVFLAALPRLRLPAAVHSAQAYLAATVKTVLADHWRRHYAAPPMASFVDSIELGPPDPTTATPDAAGQVVRVLELLPDRFRQILELRFLRGLSVRESAKEMGVTASNARVLQHRALKRAGELAEESAP